MKNVCRYANIAQFIYYFNVVLSDITSFYHQVPTTKYLKSIILNKLELQICIHLNNPNFSLSHNTIAAVH